MYKNSKRQFALLQAKSMCPWLIVMSFCGVDILLGNCASQQFLKEFHSSDRKESFSSYSQSEHLKNPTFI